MELMLRLYVGKSAVAGVMKLSVEGHVNRLKGAGYARCMVEPDLNYLGGGQWVHWHENLHLGCGRATLHFVTVWPLCTHFVTGS